MAQTFFVDEDVKANYELDAIITVVDAKHVTPHLEEEKPEGVENESVEQVHCSASCCYQSDCPSFAGCIR